MAPASWRVVTASTADLALRSASGARLEARHLQLPGADASTVLARLRASDSPTPGVTVAGATAHLVQYPAGQAAVVDVTEQGHDGELVLLITPRAVWSFELLTAGNPKARGQLESMLQKLTLS